MDQFVVRPLESADRLWLDAFIAERWGAPYVVAHDELIVPADLPGYVAEVAGEAVGVVTYRLADRQCEVVTLDSIRPHSGIGSALMEAVVEAGRAAGCARVWLTTTNDNLDALRFYQRRGFRLVAVRPGAVDEARRLKPIPRSGAYGIPIHDELQLERRLDTTADE